MAEQSLEPEEKTERASASSAGAIEENMADSLKDEEGELGEEDEGMPFNEENVDEEVAEGSSKSITKASSRSGSKSHHKSGSERRRKHHHRHHHSSSSSRSDKRRRKSGAVAPGDGRLGADEDERDFDESLRLVGGDGDAIDSGRGSRRRSGSFGDKGGDQISSNSSLRKQSNNHDYYNTSHRRMNRQSSDLEYARSGRDRQSFDGSWRDDAYMRREVRESHAQQSHGRKRGTDKSEGVRNTDEEAEDGEILEDGELNDDEDEGAGESSERNEIEGSQSKSSRNSGEKYQKFNPSDRKRGSADYRDRWKWDTDDKKRKKRLYGDPSEVDDKDDDAHDKSSPSPPATTSALPAWGSGVSQAAAKASPNNSSTGGSGAVHKVKQQASRYSRSGQSPPGLMRPDSRMSDDYMDADDKEYDDMRMKRAKKRTRDSYGDRKRGGPPRKKTLMEMDMSERPICKFYMDGKCAKGSGCQFNHDIETPRPKMENYPCKYYHTGAKCFSGDRCKFSHAPLTEDTKRALALRVAEEDIVDMHELESSSYRDYPSRDYDDSDRDYDHGDYNEPPQYNEPRSRPSLLGSPPRMRPEAKKIPSLFEIKVTPPGHSPKPGNAAQAARQTGFNNEANTSLASGNIASGLSSNNNMGMNSSGLAGNINVNQQQLGLRQGLGLLGPGGPVGALAARGPNAALMMSMQQQQQQLVRPGFGLAGPTPFMGQGNNMNNLQQQQQQRNLGIGNGNNNSNSGNLPPVLNMLGTLIRDLQKGPGSGPVANNMGNMSNSMGAVGGQNNITQNNMGNMVPNSMGNMPQNSMGTMAPNSMGNMQQNIMNNMAQNNMGNMQQNNMGNMAQNNMGNMAQNNIGNMAQNNMGNMAQNNMVNMAHRSAMNNMGPGGIGNNAMGAGNNMALNPGMSNNNGMSNMNVSNMGLRQPNLNSIGNNMGSDVMRPPMPGILGVAPNNINNNNMNMNSLPVSSSNMYNNNLTGGFGNGNFNSSGGVGTVNNPGQEVGIMDVDYRLGQQPQAQGAANNTGTEGDKISLDERDESLAEEEDSSKDLGELDKMRQKIQEQIRAEEERAASETREEDEEMIEAGQEFKRAGSEEKKPSKEAEGEESAIKEDSTRDKGKNPEAVVEIPAHLPRTQKELLKRIQQQELSRQREKEKQEAAEKAEAEARAALEAQAKAEVDDFYSSEEEGENGEKQPKLTDVLKKLNQETSSGSATSSETPSSHTASESASTTTSTTPSTFNIMQMIQAIKSKTGNGTKDLASDTQQVKNDDQKSMMISPASPPASPTDSDQSSSMMGLRLQPLTVDPPVVSARPMRPLTYSVVKLSLSQARPYVQLPANLKISDPAFRSDPRVKWHVQYMERQLKKKAAAAAAAGETGLLEASAAPKRKTSLDEDTIASPTQESSTKKTAPAVDPRLKKADPRLQKAGSSPNSSGTANPPSKAVDPRLEKAANRPSDPRLAARAMDPRLNRQNSLSGQQQGSFGNQMGPLQMGGVMNVMSGGMNASGAGMNNQIGGGMMGNPQINFAMQNQMGGFRNGQLSGGGGQMTSAMQGGSGPMNNQMSMAMNNQMASVISNGQRGGNMNPIGNSNMPIAGGMNRIGGGTMNMGMGAAGSMGNPTGGPVNSMAVRPQMQGGIFVPSGIGSGSMNQMGGPGNADMSMRVGIPNQMSNLQQGPGDQSTANMDPRLGGTRLPTSSVQANDPRLKNRSDPRDSSMAPGSSDPRDPRAAISNNSKDPRFRDPRAARQFPDSSELNLNRGSPNQSERSGQPLGSTSNNRHGWPVDEDRGLSSGEFGASSSNFGLSMTNNPPSFPVSLSQPPQSSLPASISLSSSSPAMSSSPPQPTTSVSSEKPTGVASNFDHRNDPRFKRVKRSAGPRTTSMDYSSPLASEQENPGTLSPLSVSSASDASGYNSYNRPKPPPPRLEQYRDTPSPSLPDTLEDFDMPDTSQPDIQVKDIFKSIDPTASPFC
ncbi:Zinc finger ccch domain-containing protein 6 [Plakobranchus ocellatus]|uniref:Zinc finger ccch domain-containing protein 6 n=1 Tax=Plakobranchus ocellatus TaxID=259542 RepID=A0AAV3ZHN1_9GAST|nr:Zinc finger ccch domain-containing protein 6 [Plakobranchus ocellatus]